MTGHDNYDCALHEAAVELYTYVYVHMPCMP